MGLGLGGVPVSFTLYMEFMPTKGRGVWLIWLEAFWTLGSCLEAGLAWLVLDSLGWRWLVGLSSIPLGKSLVPYLTSHSFGELLCRHIVKQIMKLQPKNKKNKEKTDSIAQHVLAKRC